MLDCIILKITFLVIDAFGKPESGILESGTNILWLGEYNECVSSVYISFQGKYCILAKPDNSTTTLTVRFIKYLFEQKIMNFANFRVFCMVFACQTSAQMKILQKLLILVI